MEPCKNKPSRSELRDLYWKQGLTQQAIAERFGVSQGNITRWMGSYDIKARPLSLRHKPHKNKPSSSELRDLYWKQGLTQQVIAKRLGVHKITIREWMRSYGIERRSDIIEVRPSGSKLRDLYWKQGLTIQAIAKRFGVCQATIRDWMLSYGITRRPKSTARCKNKPSGPKLRDLYWKQGLTTRAIAKRFGVEHITIKRWMHSYGIEMRPTGRGLANRGVKPPTRDELIQLLHVKRIGYEGVAAKFGVDWTAVSKWRIRLGISAPLRWQKRRKGTMPVLDEATICRLHDTGLPLSAIGRKFDVSTRTIGSICRRNGVTVHPSGFRHGVRFTCACGLLVRSVYEQKVADWLSSHGVPFTYEPRVPFNRRMRADFLANGWYIEVWGVTGSETYEAQKSRKVALYRAHSLPLIELVPHHFSMAGAKTLNKRLSRVLVTASLHERSQP